MATETIAQLTNKIYKGELQLKDVPEPRRTRVIHYMKIVPPETVEIIAAKELAPAVDAKPRKKSESKFTMGSRPRFSRAY